MRILVILTVGIMINALPFASAEAACVGDAACMWDDHRKFGDCDKDQYNSTEIRRTNVAVYGPVGATAGVANGCTGGQNETERGRSSWLSAGAGVDAPGPISAWGADINWRASERSNATSDTKECTLFLAVAETTCPVHRMPPMLL